MWGVGKLPHDMLIERVYKMDKFDVVDLYKKGFSIDFIINAYYKYKKNNSKDVVSYLNNKILIIKSDGVTKTKCRAFVEQCLYEYLFEKKSVEQFLEN